MPGICPDGVLYIRLGKAMEMGQFQEALGQIRFNIYPLILSALHRFGLSWETAGTAWGVAISSCTVLPLFGWIRRAFSHRVAVAACILYAIHSGLIRWSIEIIRDSTFWFLLTLSLYCLWRAATELRWSWYLAAGTVTTLACLTRFEGLVLFVPLAIWSWWRSREGKVSGGRMLALGLVCASVFPLSLMFVNALWFHGRTTELIRTEPVALAQDWAQETLAGHRAAERSSRTDLLAPLPLWKMVQRFMAGMVKGLTPTYLLAVLAGIITSRCMIDNAGTQPMKHDPGKLAVPRAPKPARLCDYQTLAYTAAPILAAIWIHLYWSHEAGPRYFFPIVLLFAPLAGAGLLQISASVANHIRRNHSSRTGLLAGTVPLLVMVVVNFCVACDYDVRTRAATIELGHWVQEHYGTAAKTFGPDGITQVVNHYTQGTCESFPETAAVAAVASRIEGWQPDIVLLSTDQHGPSHDELSERVIALGFTAVDRAHLPDGCEKLEVLVRRTDGYHIPEPSMGAGSVRGHATPSVVNAVSSRPYNRRRASAEGDKPRG